MANNIVFDGIIPAIKAIRAIPMGKVSLDTDEVGRLVINRTSMGLKEAKDLVEAIMAMGVRRYLETELAKANQDVRRDVVMDDIKF